MPFEPLLGTAQARFDPLQFNWLGSPTVETGLLGVWHTVPVNSIEDAKTREVTIGANGPHSTPTFYARLINETLGTRLKLVMGYPGQNEFNLAMEKGEVDGTSSLFYSSLVGTRPAWLREKKIKLLLQYGFEKHPKLADVPFAPDLARNADDLSLMQAAFAALGVGRPYVMPPGVPAARVRAMQEALTADLQGPRLPRPVREAATRDRRRQDRRSAARHRGARLRGVAAGEGAAEGAVALNPRRRRRRAARRIARAARRRIRRRPGPTPRHGATTAPSRLRYCRCIALARNSTRPPALLNSRVAAVSTSWQA